MNFIYFLGRFHVIVLHLPITLILVVAVFEWLDRSGRRTDLEPALRILWGATAITATATVILGYMHFSEGGFTGVSATAHRALGTSVAITSVLGWWLRSRKGLEFRRATSSVVALLVVLIFLTGHFGGNLSHGNMFLVEYAPNWIRSVIGLKPARSRVASVAAADPYLDVVRPVFERRCFECHNSAKARGGLDLSTYASAIKGGKEGRVIVKGSAAASDLIRRVSLSPGEDDFMPRESQTPLTAGQIAVLRWWIDAGAETGVRIGSMQVPTNVEKLIAEELHLGRASPADTAAPNSAPETQEIALGAIGAKVDPKLLGVLTNVGFMSRQVSMVDMHLIVTPVVPGTQFTATQVQVLAKAGTNQITQLDLSDAGLSDAAVIPVSHLSDLTELRLNRDKVTDKAVHALSGLTKLRVLGLYGNPGVTDVSLPVIQEMKSLRRVFLWGTGVSAAGVEKLRKSRPDLMVDVGDLTPAAATAPQATAISAG